MNPSTAAYRKDFLAFAMRCFAELYPHQKFIPAPYLRVLAAVLQACAEGKITRLIINMPPRHMKSHMASVSLPAFWLGLRPSEAVMCISYAQEFTEVFARQSRQVMTSPWYHASFSTRLSRTKSAVNEFVTTQGGSRVAVSVGGAITGRGADLVVIDDPSKAEDGLSPTVRAFLIQWYVNTLLSRLNNKETGCIIVVMQRLHEMDLTGFLLEQKGWTVISFPAIAEEDQTYTVDTPTGPFTYTRKVGDVLCPARESLDTLQGLKAIMGEYVFQSQYQQKPIPESGLIIKKEWFRSYVPGEEPAVFDRIIQSWDTANKVSELSDYSVCTTWGLKGDRFYLRHVLRQKMEFPELKRMIIEQKERFKASVVLVEDKASGTQLIQELRHSGLHEVQPYMPRAVEKEMRVRVQTPTIEGGFVYLPTEAPWLADYLNEMTSFPGGKHDDQVDSTMQFLDWVKGPGREPGMLGYLRMLLDENKA